MTDDSFKSMIEKAHAYDTFVDDIKELDKYNKQMQQIAKDRLDFGFDSIYFRFAAVVDELKWYKMREDRSTNYEHWANGQKSHFYECLEQLTHAHEDKDK